MLSFAQRQTAISGGEPATTRRYPLRLVDEVAPEQLDRPGMRRIRAVLTADPDRGWGEPGVRSIWPGTIISDWVEVAVVRR